MQPREWIDDTRGSRVQVEESLIDKGERYALALLTARLDMWFGSDGRTPSERTEAVRVGLDVLAEATREAPDQTIQALERIAAAGFCLLAREIGGDPQDLLRRVALGYAARREAGTP